MIEVRQAIEEDVPFIRDIFEATYGDDYIYPEFYRTEPLKKLIYADDTVLLVAEDRRRGRVVGTAAVVLESGAYSDLVGEFGRLAVHPEAWGRGVGSLLLERRVEAVAERLHVGFMEARVTHPYSLSNGLRHDFAPVGYLPQKLRFGSRREHTALLVRYFGDALDLRRNHPRIIPEAYRLADFALREVGLGTDVIVDEKAPPYPWSDDFTLQELTVRGYSSLLRIERGRLRRREIFGPLRLHYGIFRLKAEHSHYLIARREGQIVGAVGYTHDAAENHVRVFELITLDDEVVRYLFQRLEERCREELDVVCIEIDVSAHAPRMQRTLLELGYVPAAYVPALAFHEVERLDVVKMERLLIPLEELPTSLMPPSDRVAELVMSAFRQREALPRIGAAVERISLFADLTEEQQSRLAGVCTQAVFDAGERIFTAEQVCAETYLLIEGEVEVRVGSTAVGTVGPGECLGEVALLTGTPHSAEAVAIRTVRAGVLSRRALGELVRQRPDIGVVLYRNLATGLGEKLRRTDLAPRLAATGEEPR